MLHSNSAHKAIKQTNQGTQGDIGGDKYVYYFDMMVIVSGVYAYVQTH